MDAVRSRGLPVAARDLSRSQRIRADIENLILAGEWQPGMRIPFEHELMAQYGCARMTVGKAIAQLVEAGLIERRRRAGSFVRKPAGQVAILEIPDLKAEILALGMAYQLEGVTRVERSANAEDRARLGDDQPQKVLHLICLHRADGEPYAYEDRLIALGAVPDAREALFDTEPPGTWLLNHVPWQEAEHAISAVNVEARISKMLDIEPQAACLLVERKTWSNGAVLTAVRMWFPGTRQRLIARFAPRMG
jgi:GntR family transcriptional regulator, histidine utilization repressor